MCRRSLTAGVFLGWFCGSASMAAVGFALTRPEPLTHHTLPRPAYTQPAPPAELPPLDLIPPQSLPIPERP